MAVLFRRSVTAAALCLALSGCYPALRTVQPRARFVVQDASQRPIEGASVTLATRHMWGGAQTLAEFHTDAVGKVSLHSTHKWEWQILLPDGTSWYEWTYCIEKPGYRAIVELRPDFRTPRTVVLERTDRRSRCAQPGRDDLQSVIEEE